MTDNELNLTASYITALASEHNPNEKIKILLSGLLSTFRQEADFPMQQTENSVSSIITFSLKEISNMPKSFKKQFIANGLIAHVLKRKTSKHAFSYEIRYRKNGYHIYVTSYSLEIAKEKFLSAVSSDNLEKYRKQPKRVALNSFLFVTNEWLNFRKTNLNPVTLKNYESYCKRFLFPSLGGLPISSIKTIDISNIMATVQARIYEDLRVVLNSVFKYALANSLISNNPMLLIPFKKAERNNRRSLTNDELKKLFERLNLPEFKDYKQTFLILLFFGLRPCELEAARFEEDFLIARNAKRKAGKIEYKKIPICNQQDNSLIFPLPLNVYIRLTF